jgi:hypothetical protein
MLLGERRCSADGTPSRDQPPRPARATSDPGRRVLVLQDTAEDDLLLRPAALQQREIG